MKGLPNVRNVPNLAKLSTSIQKRVEWHKKLCFVKHILVKAKPGAQQAWINKQEKPEYWQDRLNEFMRERLSANYNY